MLSVASAPAYFRRALLVFIVAIGALLLAAGARASVPTGNLLVNGNAEAGTCNSGGDSQVAIPGWTPTPNFTVACYDGANGNPGASVSASINGGNNFFFGGSDNGTSNTSSATQTVDVSGSASDIDAGGVQATLSADLGGYSSQEDNMVITAVFLTAQQQPIGTPITIGPVTAEDRNDTTTLLARSAFAAVPSQTRSILVTMTATRTEGSDNDGSADNVSLTLQGPPANPQKPDATTNAATGVTTSGAILHGTVNPEGQTTTVWFNFGTTSSYGQDNLPPDSGGGTQPADSTNHAVQRSIGNLQPGTFYHYQVVARNNTGTTLGADQTFKTPPEEPTFRDGGAGCQDLASSSPSYQILVDPGGAGTSVTLDGQFVTSFGADGDNSIHTVNIPFPAMDPNSRTVLNLAFTNAAAEVDVTEVCHRPGIAPAVSAVSSSNVAASSGVISATIDPENASTQTHIEYGQTTGYGSQTSAVATGSGVASSSFTSTLSGLSPGTTYHYRVVATNAFGTATSDDHVFTTSADQPSGGPTLKQGTVLQKLKCLTTFTCLGTITFVFSSGGGAGDVARASRDGGARRVVLGHSSYRVTAHQAKGIRIKLNRRGRRLLKRHHRLRVVEIITSRGRHGHTATYRRVVVLKR